jgi:hypothetical protein
MIIQSPEELQSWRSQAEGRRLNCPKPIGLYDEAEDASGIILRLECRSPDEKSRWKLRIIFPAAGPAIIRAW